MLCSFPWLLSSTFLQIRLSIYLSVICVFMHYLCCIRVVVSMHSHKAADPRSIPRTGIQQPAYPVVFPSHSSGLVNGYLGKPGEAKLWEPRQHTGPVSYSRGILTHYRLKDQCNGEKHLTACSISYAPKYTLHVSSSAFIFMSLENFTFGKKKKN